MYLTIVSYLNRYKDNTCKHAVYDNRIIGLFGMQEKKCGDGHANELSLQVNKYKYTIKSLLNSKQELFKMKTRYGKNNMKINR